MDLNVEEIAFWHTNMDLYYGHQIGEVVEAEHESNKYWLAEIKYSFKHLMLLRWVGSYGEFWIDTSSQNSATNTSTFFNQAYNTPKRLFPLGHHLQSQLRSQFVLERPTKALIKPSFYDPAKDPYAGIKTIDDLLAYENECVNDNLMGPNAIAASEPNSLALAKCKTKISYGPEDVDELQAALQNLNDIDPDQNQRRVDSPDDFNICKNKPSEGQKLGNEHCDNSSESQADSGIPSKRSDSSSGIRDDSKTTPKNQETVGNMPEHSDNSSEWSWAARMTPPILDEDYIEICRNLQESAIRDGKYNGLGEHSENTFYMKPKQFYDLGGVNHERVFVPGTILEVCHKTFLQPKKIDTYLTEESPECDISHWFATVVKNVGGRLTLRWFLSDEPKFKQGRLEMKSIKSEYIFEDLDSESTEASNENEDSDSVPKDKIPVKDITFCMHFCDPRIFTVGEAKGLFRDYNMPEFLRKFICDLKDNQTVGKLESDLFDMIFDSRRMNLDRDRPIIDHFIERARTTRLKYIKLVKQEQRGIDKPVSVLISSPKFSRVFKGYIKREFVGPAYEIESEAIPDSGESIKFIYPYDSSYTVLPLDWALTNEDCLSVQASRNPTPSLNGKYTVEDTKSDDSLHECRQENTSDRNSSSAGNQPSEAIEPPQVKLEPDQETATHKLSSQKIACELDTNSLDFFTYKFRVMQQLEVVHPSSDVTICLGRIRKIAYPLLWIQISHDSYTLLPFNSTDIYPSGWCEAHDHTMMSLIPPRKRRSDSARKKRKTVMVIVHKDDARGSMDMEPLNQEYEDEDFNFDSIVPIDNDYILSGRATLIQIFFNHKCFTGPSLSKGKICSLPQYVGPGPLRLVMEEVMTKVISVAYVPPRILNDLSSKSFRDLLVARDMTNTVLMEFKAKYQKRVHRELVPVCISFNDVARYCECVCEHLKCCYNLFGLNLYDGDDCPGHCRALTKSNKFMKRATYYRDKARNGEFINDGCAKKSNSNGTIKTSRARYAGRDSSGSTSSTVSRSDQVNSRASSSGDHAQIYDVKENLSAVQEGTNEDIESELLFESNNIKGDATDTVHKDSDAKKLTNNIEDSSPLRHNSRFEMHTNHGSEFQLLQGAPEDWTVEDVSDQLLLIGLSKFKSQMIAEGIDGQALLLLDRVAIREHFQHQQKMNYTLEEIGKLCKFVEYVKAQVVS